MNYCHNKSMVASGEINVRRITFKQYNQQNNADKSKSTNSNRTTQYAIDNSHSLIHTPQSTHSHTVLNSQQSTIRRTQTTYNNQMQSQNHINQYFTNYALHSHTPQERNHTKNTNMQNTMHKHSHNTQATNYNNQTLQDSTQ